MKDEPTGADLRADDLDARRQAAALLGGARTPKKALSSAANGKLGGRPKGTPQSAETKAKIAEAARRRAAERKAAKEQEDATA